MDSAPALSVPDSGCSGPPGPSGGCCSSGSGQGRPRQAPLSPEAACSQPGSGQQGRPMGKGQKGTGSTTLQRLRPVFRKAKRTVQPLRWIAVVFPEPVSQRATETWPVKSQTRRCFWLVLVLRPAPHSRGPRGPWASRTREWLQSLKSFPLKIKKAKRIKCISFTYAVNR